MEYRDDPIELYEAGREAELAGQHAVAELYFWDASKVAYTPEGMHVLLELAEQQRELHRLREWNR